MIIDAIFLIWTEVDGSTSWTTNQHCIWFGYLSSFKQLNHDPNVSLFRRLVGFKTDYATNYIATAFLTI